MTRTADVTSRAFWWPASWLTAVFLVGLGWGTWRNVQFVAAHAESLAVYNLGVDAATYEEAAQRFARRPRLRLITPSQPPGFVATLGLLHRAFGPQRLPIKRVFCALVFFTALMTWRIAGRWDPLAGTIAGLLVAWSPLLQAYAATLQYEVPAAFLCTAATGLVLALARISSPRRLWGTLLAASLVCALAALTREVLVVLFPVALAAILSRRDLPLRDRLRLGAAASAIGLVLIGGWVAYQSARAGRLVPISDKGSVNLQIGNNPNANGTYNLLATSIAQPAGFAFMVSSPARTVVLFGRKALYFVGLLKDGWNVPRPAALYVSRAARSLVPLDAWLLLFRGGGVFALAALGAGLVVATPPLRNAWWPAAAVLGAVGLVHVLTLSSHRFAVPVWPIAAVLASVPLVRIWRSLGRMQPAGAAVLAAGVVWSLFAQTSAPPGRYSRAASELDGDRVENVADTASSGGVVRLGATSEGRRMIASDTAELIGRGFLAVMFDVRGVEGQSAPPSTETVVADVLVSDDAGHVICASALTWREVSQDRFSPFTTGCRLPEDTVLSVALWTRAVVELRVDRFSLSFGHARPEDVIRPGAAL